MKCSMLTELSCETKSKTAEMIEDTSLKVVCPVCEAPPGERCHVQRGVVRSESHRERRYYTECLSAETTSDRADLPSRDIYRWWRKLKAC